MMKRDEDENLGDNITLMTKSKPLHLHLSEAVAHCLLDILVISSYIA